MGASQSSRKLSVENPEEIDGLIKVTDDVVDRIRSNANPKSDDSNIKSKSVDQDISYSQNAVTVTSDFTSSHQIRKEIENQLNINNAYWENRIRKIQDAYRRLTFELQQEYKRTVQQADQYYAQPPLETDVESCTLKKQSVLECYRINKRQPLLCIKEVELFNQCVNEQTNMLLQAK